VQRVVERRTDLGNSIDEFQGLESELASIEHRLPSRLKLTQKNIFVRAYTPKLTPYIMLHLWSHQAFCHLYRLMVPGLREALTREDASRLPADFTIHCQEECLRHAVAATNVLDSVKNLGKDCWITDPALGMCVFHLSRLMTRFSKPPFSKINSEQLHGYLKVCYDSLERPAEIYPTTRILRSGIQDLLFGVAHNATTRSSSQDNASSADTSARPAVGSAVQAHKGQVYSKFSIMDEVQRLEFPTDEDGDASNVLLTPDASRKDLPSQEKVLSPPPEDVGTRSLNNHVLTVEPDDLELPTSIYDVSMLGFDFGYGADALDPFLDYSLPFGYEDNLGQPFPG
jgi:hypothetical protein